MRLHVAAVGAVLLVGTVSSRALARTLQDTAPPPDSAVVALFRGIVTDSLNSAGRRPGQLQISTDSASRALLLSAGVRLDPAPESLVCPDSTTGSGEPVAGPVGYNYRVKLAPSTDGEGWLASVGKSCLFLFRGQAGLNSSFSEAAQWEIRRVSGVWRIVRKTLHVVT
jgi:hypothetical protein